VARAPKKRVLDAVRILLGEKEKLGDASVTTIAERYKDPFFVLASCLLSLRTKDDVTRAASGRLFARARTPREILDIPLPELEELIFPVGFYRTKAKNLHRVSEILIQEHRAKVPNTLEELLALPGVGPKTANLVLSKGFNIPAICVDTHVHRISNRLGWVETKTPEATCDALKKLLPKERWIEINDLLVPFGQSVCTPISPFCSRCPLAQLCPRRGVQKSR
jgi:endonuclease-3